jgi:diguanylate cyclase (GGDEF)-like protein
MLKKLWLQLARVRWLPMAATVGLAVLAVAAVALSVQRLSVQHLHAEATRAAQGWARQVGSTVQDVDLVFMGELPSPVAQNQLIALRGLDGLTRFRLFDPEGTLVLASDAVGTAPRASDNDSESRARARAVARQGQVDVFAHPDTDHAAADTGKSSFSRAYTPVMLGPTLIGVMEADMDQGEQAVAVAESFRRASLVAGTAMALCVLLAATLMRHRARLERRARDRADFLSGHDVLTGTLNHSHFNTALMAACQRHVQRPDGGPAVICIDLDGFALINENHGHRVGDELLRLTADRLRGLLRERDRLARLAGDRFAILQSGAGDSTAVTALVHRVLRRLAEPHDLPDVPHAVRLSASVGVALYGTDSEDADTLLHNAELALLRAKSNGRGCWSFYDRSLDRRLQERRTLAHELRLALAMDPKESGLRLHFQPLYSTKTGELTGYEALARWFHPSLGTVPPMDFIPVAEDTGQIEALGRWVLHAACQEAVRWPAPLTVAVNLSAAQFRRGDAIVAEVAEALKDSGLAPARLELEITESLLMSHTEQVLSTLHALRQLGTRIAMDDFGTGYSSLAYLWRFPFDKLKIDRAFTQGLGSDARVDVIVRSIITLAHSLSIRVNAEGVETEAQQSALKRHGCDELQGYLLGKPVPAERLPHVEAETAAMVLAAV